MNINKKLLVTAMMQVTLIIPIGIALTACGGSSDDYETPAKPVPPVVQDKNDPVLQDVNSSTERAFSFVDNKNDMTVSYVDKVSKVALLNLKPEGDKDNSLNVDNISSYRLAAEDSTGDKALGATLIDSPDMLYSGAAILISDGKSGTSANNEDIITTSELNSEAEGFLRLLEKKIGSEYDIQIAGVKNGYNTNGSTVTFKGSIKRKDGKLGVAKYPVLQHKYMRDLMLSAQIGAAVWTKPTLASNWGTANAESKELEFSITTWADKGSTYLWVSAYDKNTADAVNTKFGRYNSGASVSSVDSYLEDSQSIDKSNPSLSDPLGKTERVYYLPKDGEGKTGGYNDNIGQVALLDIQPNGDVANAISAENISLYRLPKSGTSFETGVAITSDNALGAILIDDPSINYSGAGTLVKNTGDGGSAASSNQLYEDAQNYLSLLRNRIGNESQIKVTGIKRTNNNDGAVVSITGSISLAGGLSGDKYPMLQHKRLRDTLLAVQFNKEVWTTPTLSSDVSLESKELEIKVTTWAHEGSTYLWVAAYDKDKSSDAELKYGRYNSGKDLSSVKNSLIASDAIDNKDPSTLDKTSKTEQVYFFLKDSNGYTSDYTDNISKLALRNVKPSSTKKGSSIGLEDIDIENVSLLRLPRTNGQFAPGVAITSNNAIGSILLDDPSLLYSASGTMISQGSNAIDSATLTDNANNFFNLLKYRLGEDYDVDISDVERHENSDGLTITLRGTVERNDGLLGVDKFPVLHHKRIRDEMLTTLYNRPIWTMPTLPSDWGNGNSESKTIEFTVTTWAAKGSTYLWTSAYDKKNIEKVKLKYDRFDKGVDLFSSIKDKED